MNQEAAPAASEALPDTAPPMHYDSERGMYIPGDNSGNVINFNPTMTQTVGGESAPSAPRFIPVVEAAPEQPPAAEVPATEPEPLAVELPSPAEQKAEQSESDTLRQEIRELREQLQRQQEEQTKATRDLNRELRNQNKLIRQLLERERPSEPAPKPTEPAPEPTTEATSPEPELPAESTPEPEPTPGPAPEAEAEPGPAPGEPTPEAPEEPHSQWQKIKDAARGKWYAPAVWWAQTRFHFEDNPEMSEEDRRRNRRNRRLGLATGVLAVFGAGYLLGKYGVPFIGDDGNGQEYIPPLGGGEDQVTNLGQSIDVVNADLGMNRWAVSLPDGLTLERIGDHQAIVQTGGIPVVEIGKTAGVDGNVVNSIMDSQGNLSDQVKDVLRQKGYQLSQNTFEYLKDDGTLGRQFSTDVRNPGS